MESRVRDNPGAGGATAEQEQVIAHLKELMVALTKAIHAVRIYPPTNPMPRAFLDELCAQFDGMLEQYGNLTLQITAEAFLFKDAVIYLDANLSSSLAFLLYKDGLREIAFCAGMPRAEIVGLVELFAMHENMNRLEDDYVTLLWEMNFTHIFYDATDVSPDDGAGFAVKDSVREVEMPVAVPSLAAEGDLALLAGMEDLHEGDDTIAFARATEWQAPSSEVIELKLDERERMMREVDVALNQPGELMVIDILFEILQAEERLDPCRDVLNLLVKIIGDYLEQEKYADAAELLQRLHVLLPGSEPRDGKAALLRDAIETLSDPRRIERLGQALLRAPETRQIYDLLRMLRVHAVQPLITVLSEVRSTAERKTLCEFLAVIGKDAIHQFLPFLGDPRWYVVRNIVHILGMMGSAEAVPGLMKAYQHPDVRVRREVMQALGSLADPQVGEVCQHALEDADPFIRGMAAVILGQVGGVGGLRRLILEVQSRAFARKESIEVLSFFHGIGATRLPDAVGFLRRKLLQASWFNRQHLHDLHMGAAQALALIGTPEADDILYLGLRAKNASIRAACQHATRGRHLHRSVLDA